MKNYFCKLDASFAIPSASSRHGEAVDIIMRDCHLPKSYRFAKNAYPVLAFAIAHMLTVYYHRGLLCQRHAKRKQLKLEDVRLGELLGQPDLVLKSLQDCQETEIQMSKVSEGVKRKKRRRLVRQSSAPKTRCTSFLT